MPPPYRVFMCGAAPTSGKGLRDRNSRGCHFKSSPVESPASATMPPPYRVFMCGAAPPSGKGLRDRNSRGCHFRSSPKCFTPLGGMRGPTLAISNHLGHSLAKIAEALGISEKITVTRNTVGRIGRKRAGVGIVLNQQQVFSRRSPLLVRSGAP